jgi:hypothetical protein
MKKWMILTVLLGWFFGLRIPHPDTDSGAISIVVGPFRTEAACKVDLQHAIAFFELGFTISQVVKCVEKVET